MANNQNRQDNQQGKHAQQGQDNMRMEGLGRQGSIQSSQCINQQSNQGSNQQSQRRDQSQNR